MKKILYLVFCVLFAGSALLQSCSKPDAVMNTPDPTNPTLPVDSIEPEVPSVPLTEAQIIQKAIEKLPGTYLMTGREWDMIDITLYGPGGGKATDTFGSHKSYGNSNLITQEFKMPFDNNLINHISFVMKYDSNTYYNRIFVNAAGDSFIAAQCGGAPRFKDVSPYFMPSGTHDVHKHNENPLDVKASDFWDVSKFNNVKVDSGKYSMFYDPVSNFPDKSTNGYPLYQVQYFYKKDSLVIYKADLNNIHGSAVPNSNNRFAYWLYRFGYQYGKKVK